RLAAVYEDTLDAAIGRVPIGEGCTPSQHLYPVLVDNRDAVMLALNARNIYPGVHYRDNTDYRMYNNAAGQCPAAAAASARCISLPLHLLLTEDDARRVSDAVNAAVRTA